MPLYSWKGTNRYGDEVQGERMAATQDELLRTLQKEQITVSNVTIKRRGFSIPFIKRERVKLKELAIYSRQLSVLIDAELPLIQSLNILTEQTRNKYFKGIIAQVREDVEAGSSLNQAKRKHPKAFDDLYCNLIASGEQSGSLDIMLRRLSEFIEKIVRLRSKVRQAMIYPAAIITFAIVVAIFLLWKVIPIFASIFQELGASLPFLTVIVMKLSNFTQNYIVFIFLGLIGLFFLFRYFRNSPRGRVIVDRTLLRIPLVGKILEKVAVSRITRTLSTLLSGGVSMLESLRITSSTAGNVILEGWVMESRRLVAEGKSLTDGLREAGAFPFMMTQMVSVGEATGTLDEMLSKLADFYDEEVDTSVASMLSILEPVMLILVGGLVGSLVISMYLPIFSLLQQF
jgi:type IV pilus assembly protein PilC